MDDRQQVRIVGQSRTVVLECTDYRRLERVTREMTKDGWRVQSLIGFTPAANAWRVTLTHSDETPVMLPNGGNGA